MPLIINLNSSDEVPVLLHYVLINFERQEKTKVFTIFLHEIQKTQNTNKKQIQSLQAAKDKF